MYLCHPSNFTKWNYITKYWEYMPDYIDMEWLFLLSFLVLSMKFSSLWDQMLESLSWKTTFSKNQVIFSQKSSKSRKMRLNSRFFPLSADFCCEHVKGYYSKPHRARLHALMSMKRLKLGPIVRSTLASISVRALDSMFGRISGRQIAKKSKQGGLFTKSITSILLTLTFFSPLQ